ncbi:Thiol-disulfide oxidoreductase ResA [Caulifigura coniformis]|uniref:Thiol-disulfide oxidoreductase ResA n=1 Tax=Caulifigura coniformis TaxID=2527983 RepID=A0A517SK47_9PLAN|nr:TlpA disulfide reductase family protein [Caulifigura coniformis]QDT56490.1 Thiol-disulfide oxidoreductase ResA [Caulifigura coniformis]
MPRLWLSRRVAPIALVSLLSSSSAFAQDESKAPPAPTDQPAITAPADAPQVDPFQIPDGNDPQVLQKFLERLFQTPPANRSLSGRQEHLRKVEAAIAKVQQKELDEATALTSSDMRFQILQFLERSGDPAAAADRQRFIETLSKHKLPKVAERGTLYGLAVRVSGMGGLKADARQKLIDDVAAYIGAGEVSEERYSLATQTPELLAQLGDNELAAKALETFAKAFESRKDDRVSDLVNQLRATGRRYGLVGKPMKVEGKTVDGKPFNVESLKGKVVLVDFWATWCGPCLEELPHVQELYNGYNKKGFEVVGVSLDQEKDVLQAFLAEKKLPWVQLYSEAEGDGGWSNPIARYYGISAIPTAILIGKDGNVVSLNATGRELTALLEKLLGPPDAPKEEAPKSE